jgi:(p)ppGpp synthase/HD superfamily hydrolase
VTNNQTFPLERAIAIAALAHRGQVDKAGAPYIFHPLRVMLALEDPQDRIVAVLHDTLEDTHLNAEYFRRRGLPEELITSLECLTHHRREPYVDYITRVATDPRATRVKLADLSDNMDLGRVIPGETVEETTARLIKYGNAFTFLAADK